MIGFIESITSGGARTASKKEIDQVRGLKAMSDIYEQIKNGNTDLKKRLPALMPNGISTDGSRKAASCVPTNNVFLDYDTHDGWQTLYEKVKDHFEEWHIRLFEISARGGAHMVVPQITGKTIKETIQIWADHLGVEFDHVSDLSRLMYLTPLDNVLWESPSLYEKTETEEVPFPVKAKEEKLAVEELRQLGEFNDVYDEVADKQEKEQQEAEKLQYFKGIPYSKIIDQLLFHMGVDGAPAEGERNNTLYKLVRELRYICEFDADRIQAVVPTWGLTADEVKSTIKSALSTPRKYETPPHLQHIVDMLSFQGKIVDEDTPVPWEQIPDDLPEDIKLILSKYPDSFQAPVLATLPSLMGTLATNLRAEYLDGAEQSPSFFCCVVAPQASGKSYTRTLYDILMAPLKEQDKEYRKLERDYRQKKNIAKKTSDVPEEPLTCIRLLPPQTSNSTLLKRADLSNDKHLMIFTEELDSLYKSERSGAWSQKSDIYRKAFDNAEIGQDYMSADSYSGVVKIFLNLLVCCTPHAKNRFFADCEDGLVSRFTFINLPDNLGSRIPKFGTFNREERKHIHEMAHRLMAIQGSDEQQRWIECPELSDSIDYWLEQKRMEYLQSQDHPSVDVFRRRAAVIGFRTGMLAFALEGFRWTPAVSAWATWMAEYTLQNQIDLFGEQMDLIMLKDTTEETQTKKHSGANFLLFDQLGDTFTMADIINRRLEQGKSGDARYIPCRWKKQGMCVPTGVNQWTKTKEYQKKKSNATAIVL